MYYNEKEYSTKPDINGNRYSVIFNPVCKWFRRGLISRHTSLTNTIRVRKLTYLYLC